MYHIFFMKIKINLFLFYFFVIFITFYVFLSIFYLKYFIFYESAQFCQPHSAISNGYTWKNCTYENRRENVLVFVAYSHVFNWVFLRKSVSFYSSSIHCPQLFSRGPLNDPPLSFVPYEGSKTTEFLALVFRYRPSGAFFSGKVRPKEECCLEHVHKNKIRTKSKHNMPRRHFWNSFTFTLGV